MDLILLKDFFTSYSLPTLIVAIAVSAVCTIIYKTVGDKIPKIALSYAPFVLSVLLYFAYDAIFVLKTFAFRSEALYAGLLSGSLSAVISSALKKIAAGKTVGVSATVLLIEGLLEGYINKSAIPETALTLEKILLSESEDDEKTGGIIDALKDNATEFSEEELLRLANLIVQAVKSLSVE